MTLLNALYINVEQKKRLAAILHVSLTELTHIDSIINYNSFSIAKKNSIDKRIITAPDKHIKKIQKRILVLLQKVIRPEWLISGEKGKSYVDNGKTHINGNYVLTMDIQKFYDHCSREAVYQFFIKKMMVSPDIATILTDITTYNGGIPTGCPTSQLIAFYAYHDMFSEIANIAIKYNCVFTLYVDDMTFSCDKPIPPKTFSREIECVLRKYKHKIKQSKTKYYRPSDYKTITGTVISPSHKIKTPNSLQHKVHSSFIKLKPKLLDNNAKLTENEEAELSSLIGSIQASRNIEENKFPEIGGILKAYSKQIRKKN